MSEKKQAIYNTLNDEQKAAMIPFYLHENEMYRLERLNKRWFIAFLIVLVMLFVTNGAWIFYEMQYEEIRIEQEGETDNGGDNIFNGTGRMILYGESEADNQDTPQEGNGEQDLP